MILLLMKMMIRFLTWIMMNKKMYNFIINLELIKYIYIFTIYEEIFNIFISQSKHIFLKIY